MKNLHFRQSVLVAAAVVGLGVLSLSVGAQDASTAPATTSTPAPVSAPVPVALSSGATQVLQLSRAKVGDGTIMAFIQNSEAGFTMSADQIIYLKQQGVSDAILNAMLTQPKNGAASTVAAPTSAPAPATVAAVPVATTTTVVAAAPATTVYVPAATSYYYYPPLYRNYPYSYDSCWVYPSVSFSFGYRGGWGGGGHGGGWHGGHR